MPLEQRPDTPIAADDLPVLISDGPERCFTESSSSSSEVLGGTKALKDDFYIQGWNNTMGSETLAAFDEKLCDSASNSLPKLTEQEANQIRLAVHKFCPVENLPYSVVAQLNEDEPMNGESEPVDLPKSDKGQEGLDVDPSLVAQYITPVNISALLHKLPKPWPSGLVNQSIMAFLESQDNYEANESVALALEDLRSQMTETYGVSPENLSGAEAKPNKAKVTSLESPSRKKRTAAVPASLKKRPLRIQTESGAVGSGADKGGTVRQPTGRKASEATLPTTKFAQLKLKAQAKRQLLETTEAVEIRNGKKSDSDTRAEPASPIDAAKSQAPGSHQPAVMDMSKVNRLTLRERLERNKQMARSNKSNTGSVSPEHSQQKVESSSAVQKDSPLSGQKLASDVDTTESPKTMETVKVENVKAKRAAAQHATPGPSAKSDDCTAKASILQSPIKAKSSKVKEPLIPWNDNTSIAPALETQPASKPIRSKGLHKSKPLDSGTTTEAPNLVPALSPAPNVPLYGYAWPPMQIYYGSPTFSQGQIGGASKQRAFPIQSVHETVQGQKAVVSASGPNIRLAQQVPVALPFSLFHANNNAITPATVKTSGPAASQVRTNSTAPYDKNKGIVMQTSSQPMVLGYYNFNNLGIPGHAFYQAMPVEIPDSLVEKKIATKFPVELSSVSKGNQPVVPAVLHQPVAAMPGYAIPYNRQLENAAQKSGKSFKGKPQQIQTSKIPAYGYQQVLHPPNLYY